MVSPTSTQRNQSHEELPQELRSLVKKAINLLGEEIQNVYGEKIYAVVESLRKEMKTSRTVGPEKLTEIMEKQEKKLNRLESEDLYKISHSFGLYLEIINRCEKAYRHFRLSGEKPATLKKSPYAIIYVFTAHPTEARSPEVIELLSQIEDLLIELLSWPNSEEHRQNLSHLIHLILRTPLSKAIKPTVEEEADQIYSIVLDHKILGRQIALKKQNITVHFRTWVGGDKDGHPFVTEKSLYYSLKMSRYRLWLYLSEQLENTRYQLQLISPTKEGQKLEEELESLQTGLNELKKLQKGDGSKIKSFRKKFHKLYDQYYKVFSHQDPHLENASHLLWLYPALVLPLEVREDSSIVNEAANGKAHTITKMLKKLHEISEGFRPKWYVRGFVISMTESSDDMIAGIQLIKQIFGKLEIPVVPLFETRHALENATTILTEVYQKEAKLVTQHQDQWEGRFEVMLGYSDSSKESGVFSSRSLIATALNKLDRFLKKYDLTPVFFHGSGGSIERGGGSVREQTSWWPKSALHIFKVTVQGEMVSRNFGDELIMQSQVEKILEEMVPYKKPKVSARADKAIKKFSDLTAENYQKLLHSEDFIHVVKTATPYSYLNQLRIGSRPSKRSGEEESGEFKLRAIPWVLCWTQTRALLPTWYGVGSAWEALSLEEKYLLLKEFENSMFLTSFVKVLGFTLAKVELGVFRYYLKKRLSKKHYQNFSQKIEAEHKKTLTFFYEITRQKELLWFRPWLSESIKLRSSMIHPLNIIQLIALEREDPKLLRESVTGIACGMMTTG